MKKSTTKRALFLSFVSMFLCFTMLLGTTYAWFTDSVASDVNTIVAGNLDVELYNGRVVDEQTKVTGDTLLFDGIALWEPGAAVYENFTVANEGNLALKYQLAVKIFENTGAKNLADVLKVGVVTGGIADNTSREDAIKAVTEWIPFKTFEKTGNLEPSTTNNPTTDTYGVVVYWQPSDKDNEYNMNNGKTEDDQLKIKILVNLFATQLGSENDSFGNDYDANIDGVFTTNTSFSNANDLLAFGSNSGLEIKDGKALVNDSGATNTAADKATDAEQTQSYEMDITDVPVGEDITIAAGVDENVYNIERGSAKITKGTKEIGVLNGTSLKVTHTSYVNANGELVVVTTFTDGIDVVTDEYVKEISAEPVSVSWKILDVSDAAKGKVTIDNFTYEKKAAAIDSAVELVAAIYAVEDSGTVTLAGDVTSVDGILITDKNVTIDLNGKTFTVSEGASTSNRNFKITGNSNVTIKNGTMVAAGDYSSGAYGTVRTEGSAVVTLTDLKLYNYRGNGLNIKALTGTTVNLSNTEIYSQYGGGIESAGATITVDNVKVEQKGMYTAPYNSMAISVNGGGKVTVNSGTFSTECLDASDANNQGSSHGPWVIGVLNSGGTLTVNGGTFSNDNYGDNSLATAARGVILADTGANVIVNGGTFNALATIVDIQNNLGDASKNPVVTLKGGIFSSDPTANNKSNCIVVAEGYSAIEVANNKFAVMFGDVKAVSTADELNAALKDDAVVYIKENISDATIELPATLNNVTIKAAEGVGFVNSTVMACDGNSISYDSLTFDGVTFDNSRISITGWRTGGASVKNLTVTNCVFKNLDDTTNSAPLHINMAETEPVNGLTFTNNVIDGATGGSKSGIYAQVTGKTIVTGNVINNVAFRPYVIQVTTDDGIADEFVVTGNTFSGSSVGRAQGLGNNDEGTDTVKIVISGNIFKGITDSQQICYWNFNSETTTADLSKNYYDYNIVANPSRIYYNKAASSVADLVEMGIYPFYTELNEDGTINTNSLVEAPQ